MNKRETTEKICSLLKLLTTGTGKETKEAKKEIEKIWHKDSKQFSNCASVVLDYLAKFDQIKNIENQKAFISGISLFFLALSDKYFDILKDFTLKVLQHPQGHVREAIRKTADWLFISLTNRAEPFVFPKGKELSQKQRVKQLEARQQYINLVEELEELIEKYDRVENIRYIDEMKPSINKSLQLYWSRLTEGRTYRKVIEQNRFIPYEIMRKREEIEHKLSLLLQSSNSDFEVEDIKDIIYHENGQDTLSEIIDMFNKEHMTTEISVILEIINDAWNYFPHKLLNGFSPVERLFAENLRAKKENKLTN